MSRRSPFISTPRSDTYVHVTRISTGTAPCYDLIVVTQPDLADRL